MNDMLRYPARYVSEGDCYSLYFIDLPDIVTQGDDREDLIEMAEDALSETLAYMYETDRSIPMPSEGIKGDNIIYIDLDPKIALPVIIRGFRKKAGLTQEEISRKIGIAYTTYQRWEDIERFNPTLKTLKKIAEVLGRKVTIDMVLK